MSDAGELEALVNQHMIAAMKAHNAERTGTLRLIKTALKNRSIDKRAPLTQAEGEQSLATMIKQRRDSIEQFTNGGRPELADGADQPDQGQELDGAHRKPPSVSGPWPRPGASCS